MADTNAGTTGGPGNEINFWGRLTAGILLIFLTGAVIVTLMAFWPNKTPDFKAGDDGAWYTFKLFNMTLIENNEPGNSTGLENNDQKSQPDSLKLDSVTKARLISPLNPSQAPVVHLDDDCETDCCERRIHLNTILLLLVALMGFLGNMVHIASSFTSYVGNNTFKRSWILWYFVKPFTAAGLAVIIYFIIRAGFLSYGSGAAGISLYGILSLSALAGLFTDSATLKLKEVFDVIFKTKDDRKDKLHGDDTNQASKVITVSTVLPLAIPAATETTITITGTNFDQSGLSVAMSGIDMTAEATITATSIVLNYTPTAADTEAGKVEMKILDKAGIVLNVTTITITA